MTECIEWEGAKSRGGYGQQWYEGKVRRAHRVAYCKANGRSSEDIDGQVVRHKCDNPSCVNPDHLEIGTQADNVRDRDERGRAARLKGEAHGNCIYSDSLVAEILSRHVRGCPVNGGAALAREFGVSTSHVSRIVNERSRAA